MKIFLIFSGIFFLLGYYSFNYISFHLGLILTIISSTIFVIFIKNKKVRKDAKIFL